jgi:hypothetical protein
VSFLLVMPHSIEQEIDRLDPTEAERQPSQCWRAEYSTVVWSLLSS